jgi:hypothetical protein
MRPDRVFAFGLALLAAGTLAACGADDEPSSRNVAATTTTTTAKTATTAASTTPAAATPAAGSQAAAGATAAGTATTPGVGGAGSTPVNAQDAACANASGQRTAQDSGASLDATTAVTAATTTPADATTTPTTTTPATTTPTESETAAPDADTADANTTTAVAADQSVLPRPFSATSPWNTPVDSRAADTRSDDWIERASRRIAVVESQNRGSVSTTERTAPDLRLYVNTCAWTPTIVSEEGGETVRVVCRQRNCGPVAKQLTTLRVTPGVNPFPEFDGWYSVIDQASGVGYDMWRARRVGDVISYQFIKRWPLNGPGFSAPAIQDATAAVGARGSGLPLFAGVIQPSELRQGRIDHALAMSVPGPAQRIFVQPASVTNGINVIDSLPEGARLRLKSSFQIGRLPRGANRRSAEAIVTALRTYGAIVVDRSITPTLYARRSTNYGTLLLGNELQGIRLTDLEVVQSGTLLRFPPLEATPEAVQG